MKTGLYRVINLCKHSGMHKANIIIFCIPDLTVQSVYYCTTECKTEQDRLYTRWFKYDRDDLCVNKSQFVPVIFEPPCTYNVH